MTARQIRRADIQFFYDRAGSRHKPGREKIDRVIGAIELANAEAIARQRGWYFDWQVEPDWARLGHEADVFPDAGCYPDESGWCKNHPEYGCALYDSNEDVLVALGGIDDPTTPYRRVVEAELAIEAIASEAI